MRSGVVWSEAVTAYNFTKFTSENSFRDLNHL